MESRNLGTLSMPAPGTMLNTADTNLNSSAIDAMLGRVITVMNPRGNLVKLRLVKNASGGNLTGKSLVARASSAARHMKDVSGVAAAEAFGELIYEAYGTVPDGYTCYVVVQGEAVAQTSASTNSRNTIAVGGKVISAGSGRVWAQSVETSAAAFYPSIQNAIGRALSATTTTDQEFYVNVMPQ